MSTLMRHMMTNAKRRSMRPTPHRRSLDIELGEDDVGDRRRRGTLAPRSQLTTLLLVLGRILNIKLIVVGKPYCCLLLVLNINNNNFS